MNLKTRTRMARAVLGAAVATTLLAGCAVGGATDTSSSSSTAAVAGTSASSAAGSAEATGTVAGSSYIVSTTEPGDLNPGKQITAYDQDMAMYTSLTSVATDGTVTMAAAESVESDDATTWTITLRSGWTFHNGEPVTAQSYVDAWNATAYGPNAWANSGQLAEIVGYDDLNPETGEPTVKEMSGLKVVNDTTFTVQLSAPDGQFPLQLSQAMTGLFPMPKAAFTDLDAYNKQPIGNGPYMMTTPHEENQDIVLTAYPDYAGTPAKTETVTFKMYTDTSTAYTDALAGNVDVVGVGPEKIVSAVTDFGDRLYVNEAPGIAFLGLPTWDPRYSDVRVRQAISMAIDRDSINEAIYAGKYTPATSFTPPTEPGTPENACGEWCTYDPTKAKELLDAAGGWTGSMEITYPGGFGLDELYKAYANQIRRNLGIEDVTTKATADFAEFAQIRTDAQIGGPYFSRWGALYPSQQNTLKAFFVPGGGGGCTNCSALQPQEVQDLIAQADGQVDQDKAIEFYQQAQAVLAEQLPIIPMFYEKYMFVTSEKITALPSSQGSPVWAGITVS
ncbi:ABC transporter substrate-binding protein [Nakamurella flavida]|uniref:ABC transporter substrate-binding protein n=1 Tax=Nakamurella flavida TaxID=363630 RepID=A0A938YM28_9ACTN|nr:ABC transporter substrate-binding protein [Nakamurella flavida]MBM9477699.1 ABC transporter substrate-binding protein [Nakamurella flavida]MDP9779251.1 ABC-type transport system substrate-binding protein [Nakamurella flavida]